MNLRLLLDRKNWEKLFFVYRHNKNNSKMEMAYNHYDASIKVYGFYHAYCLCNSWEELFVEQLEHLISSGLYDRMDKLYIGVLITKNNIRKLDKLVQAYNKLEILYTSEDGTLFEFQTLIEMQKKTMTDKFFGFYFHTKGVTWLNVDNKIYSVGNSWRKMNEYFLFDRWKLAFSALKCGYDLYGTNYQKIFNDKYRLLGMNFFWFRSDYVSRLAKLYVEKNCRNLSEVWICSRSWNVYCPFEFSGNSRNSYVPEEFYIGGGGNRKWLLVLKIYFTRFDFWIKYLRGNNNQINPKVNTQRGLTSTDFEYLNNG